MYNGNKTLFRMEENESFNTNEIHLQLKIILEWRCYVRFIDDE